MNIAGSSAWLSSFAGDANADKFSWPIENIDKLIVPSITITEVFKCIFHQRGDDMAMDAAQYGIELKLPLADSIIYATARKYAAVIWTQDVDFKSLEGVKYYSRKAPSQQR